MLCAFVDMTGRHLDWGEAFTSFHYLTVERIMKRCAVCLQLKFCHGFVIVHIDDAL